MGLPKDCTAGAGITAIDRLRTIGNGWDLNVVKMLLRFSKMVGKSTKAQVAQAQAKKDRGESAQKLSHSDLPASSGRGASYQ